VSNSTVDLRRRTLRRVPALRGRGAQLLALPALFLLILVACGPRPPVTTSTGAIVPAATVEAQDTIADFVSEMKASYLQAIAAHDARAGTESAELHAKHRAALLDVKAGLKAVAHPLAAWKASSAAATPAEVIRPLVASARSFLDLAVELNVMKPERAAAIRVFLDTAFPPGGAV
jgi:hypothetical protein